ncbi:MAG: hypothetical protein JNM74_05095 [Myxococcales bacterium]|nr:hypothetical protein [Myxococcales bacterium]
MRTMLKALGPSLLVLALALGVGSVAACSGSMRAAVFDDAGSEGGAANVGEEAGALFEDAAPEEDLSPKGTWTGTVYTPAGEIPVAGALVYLSPKRPAPMPQGNFCDTCVPLEKSIPQTLTKADGTFELVANRLGKQVLVIQKGQFRRVVEVDVTPGDRRISRGDTTLPRQNDAAKGDQVPSILVVDTAYDDIEETLDGLGIPRGTVIAQSTRLAELRDAARLDTYQIIFLPCGECGTRGGGTFDPPASHGEGHAMDPVVQANLKAWVRKGGKLYVTDFAYSFVNETWKDYVRFSPNKGCNTDAYDTPATLADPGLEAWLAAQGDRDVTFENAWVKVEGVNEVTVPDGAGGTKKVVPKVWAYGNDNGKNRPMTLSFEDGCGRVLYSAYHTEGTGSLGKLLPQEKALMYVLFEVSTCVVDPVIPR